MTTSTVYGVQYRIPNISNIDKQIAYTVVFGIGMT